MSHKWFLALLLYIGFSLSGNLTGLAQEQSGTPAEKWFRGNLHTHSLWSDGNDFPEMITKWYQDNGYHFLALTDHNILSEGEKWISEDQIRKRGNDKTIENLVAAFGSDWIDRRVKDDVSQIRLKGLAEFRNKFEQRGKFLMMTGEEISDSVEGLPLHMNATNLESVIQPAGGKSIVEAMNNNLRIALEQSKTIGRPILVHLNHPNYGWAVTAEDLAQVTLERFFEVYNGHPEINHLGASGRPSVERLWDIANTLRVDQLNTEPLLGLATDDSHHYNGTGKSRPGRGWVMVRASELSPDSIIRSMNRGNYYCSSGVKLLDLNVDDQAIELKMSPRDGVTYTTEFIGTLISYDRSSKKGVLIKNSKGKPLRISRVYSDDVGRVLKRVDGNSASYRFSGNEIYVRALITSSVDHPDPSFKNQKQQAWTQPIVVKK